MINSTETIDDGAEAPRSKVKMVEVSSHYDGQRLDNFLLHELKGVPKSMIYRIIRKGEVRVNKGRAKPETKLHAGDQVRIPPVRTSEPSALTVSPYWQSQLQNASLYEDDQLLIINKPAGIAVHRGSGLDTGIIECLRALRDDLSYLELAHRLDLDTSGCLVLAKTGAALREVQQQLRESDKRYLTLVQGHWDLGSCEIQLPLARNLLQGGERLVKVDEKFGKIAITRFSPVEHLAGATLLEARLLTGRTHQIRVHTAEQGHPVAGDDKYGNAGFNQELSRKIGLKRLFLHAHSLMFSMGNKEIAVSSPLTTELNESLNRLEGIKPQRRRR